MSDDAVINDDFMQEFTLFPYIFYLIKGESQRNPPLYEAFFNVCIRVNICKYVNLKYPACNELNTRIALYFCCKVKSIYY